MAENTGIFICPACQAVVKGDPTSGDGFVCSECEHEFGGNELDSGLPKTGRVRGGRSAERSSGVTRDVTGRKAPPVLAVGAIETPPLQAKTMEEVRADADGGRGDEEIIMPDGTRRVRRRKRKQKAEKNKSLILFLLAWFSVVIIIFALFKMKNGGGNDKPPPDNTPDNTALNEAMMMKMLPKIAKQFQGFLFAPTQSERGQYIDRSGELSFAFSKFHEFSEFPKPTSSISLVDENVLEFSEDEIGIETIWEDGEGHKWGALHVFDKAKSWRLDWENFAPNSSESWAKFRANLGSSEGEFRLLVRKRLASNEDDRFYLIFYRPPHALETENEYKSTQSPEVEIKTNSELGKQFLKLWADFEAGKSPYGSILGKSIDPDNHLRLNARLAWEKNKDDEDVMVLKEIIGVAWFGARIQEFHEAAVKKVTEEATDKLSEETSEGL